MFNPYVLVNNVNNTTKRIFAELRPPRLQLLGLTNIAERPMGTGDFCIVVNNVIHSDIFAK